MSIVAIVFVINNPALIGFLFTVIIGCSFVLQDSIKNLFATMVLYFYPICSPGDVLSPVTKQGVQQQYTFTELGLSRTLLTNDKGKIYVPNSDLLNYYVVKYT